MIDGIPEGWESHELAHLARIETGGTPPTSDRSLYGNDAPFASPADIGGQRWIVSTEKNLSLSGWKRVRRLPAGAILVVCIGSTIGKVGMAAVPMATNQQINAVIPSDNIDGGFLYYSLCLSSDEIKGQASEQAVPIINKSTFGRLRIAVPPLREQQAIAAALSDADGVVAGLERVIAKKRLIKQGAMQDLLTARCRLPGFSGEWELKRLGEIARIVTGRTPETSQTHYYGSEHPFVSPADLGKHKFVENTQKMLSAAGLKKACALPQGAILFTCIGTIGKVGIAGRELATNQQINAAISVEDVNSEFLYYALDHLGPKIASQAGEQVLPIVNKTAFEAVVVRLPQSQEQQAIAAVLSDMDAEIQTLESRLTKARAVKEGMMQNLLTGRVRLV